MLLTFDFCDARLGRAVPFYDEQGKNIIKWFGTCTDIHELVEARQAAKDTREQLRQVIQHARVTLWAVNSDLNLVLLEGALLRPCASDHVGGSLPYIGRNINDVFGKNPFIDPMKRILDGKCKEDIVEFVGNNRQPWPLTLLIIPSMSRKATCGIALVCCLCIQIRDLVERRRRCWME
jgi:hypothetical protein